MTPKLQDLTMLSRGANLSTRKPLLGRPVDDDFRYRAGGGGGVCDDVPSMFTFDRHQPAPAPPPQTAGPQIPRLRDEGPFVFGVHSPSQFQIRSRVDGSHDCVDDTTVINLPTCDKRQLKRNGLFGVPAKDNKDSNEERRPKRECFKRNKTKERIKCVLVGDGAVGKTSLIASYAQNKFLEDYEPTAFDNFNVIVEVDGRPVNVEICDTAGQDSLAGLRELCYPGTDVLLLCFSVVKPETFRSITKRWAPAVTKLKAPLILIGTQIDLLDDRRTISDLYARGDRPVSDYEIKQLASKLKAPYVETSARQRTKLKDAFDTAILAGLRMGQSKKSLWKKLFCIS